MSVQKLTDNGIDKILGDIGGVVVQCLAVLYKFRNNQHFYGCELSDGFCKLKNCLILIEIGDEEEQQGKRSTKGQEDLPVRIKQNMIIQIIVAVVQTNKMNQRFVIVQKYKIHQTLQAPVGRPMYYEDFIKNGKMNPQGSNVIPKNKIQKKIMKLDLDEPFEQSKIDSHPNESFQLSRNSNNNYQKDNKNNKNTNNSNKVSTNFPQKLNKFVQQNVQGENTNTKNTNTNTNTNLNKKNIKSSNINQNSNTSLNIPKNQATGKNDNFNATKGNSLQVKKGNDNERRLSPSYKGQQKRPTSEHHQIKNLFVGIQNWAILGRVLFIRPLKQIMTKKGTESSILSIEIGDKTGTIQCTMFGQVANKFENAFQQDQIYEICDGFINENTYMGASQLRISINQHTKVNLKEENPNVPFSQDFCINVKQLMEASVGSVVTVICLVKDEEEAVDFVSKQGKNLRKKNIYLCDPENKVEVNILLWNNQAETKFQRFPYMIKGVCVKEYNGNKQYSLRTNYCSRILRQHSLRKYIKDMQSIQFYNPESNRKNRASTICNFKELNNLMDEDNNPNGMWSQVICCISSIRLSSTNYYLACPFCKKKVVQSDNSVCEKCGKDYEKAYERYVMSVGLSDQYGSIWATAYDEVGEKIMGVTANHFASLKEEEQQKLVKKISYKEIKLRMVTNSEIYMGDTKKRTRIIKIIDIKYKDQVVTLLNKLLQLKKLSQTQ